MELQQADREILRLNQEVAALPKRVAAIEAETEAQKGVRGTARRVRKALTGKQGPNPKKGKK